MHDCDAPPPPLLLVAIEQFNRGEYFEQHEILEALWREESRGVRGLYQGLLQIGVACYHVQRRNRHGAEVMLERGLARLAGLPAVCRSIDVARLIDEAARMLAWLRAHPSDDLAAFDWALAPRVVCRDG